MAAITVASTSRVWREASTTSYWTARCAVDTGSALYVVTTDTTGATRKIRVYKADSRTAPTAFTEQDSANNKTVSALDVPISIWPAGGMIHVIGHTTGTNISHFRFDTSTDLWTTGHGSVGVAASLTRPTRVVVRSDNDVLVFYTSSADTADIGWARWEGASWTVAGTGILAIASAEGSTILDAGIDSTDRAWVAFANCLDDDIEYLSINSANTVTAITDVEATGATADTAHSSGGVFEMYDASGTDTVVAAYLNSGPAIDERVVSLEADAASGRLAAEVAVETTTGDVGARTPIATARIGTTDYAMWWDDASSGTIFYKTKTAGSWGGRTAWKTGVSRPVQLIPIGAGLACVYHSDATTVQFDWVVAPSGDASATITRDQLAVSGKTFTVSAGASATITADTLAVSGKTFTVAAGQGASATITADALTVSGNAFTVSAGTSATITADTLTVSGQSFTAVGQRNESVTITTDALAVTGQAFTAGAGASATITADALTVSENAFTVSADTSATITRDQLAILGQAFAVSAGASASIAADVLSVLGQSFTASDGSSGDASATITADALAVIGNAFTVSAGSFAAIAADSLAVSGKTFTVSADASASVAADALAVSGKAFTVAAGTSATVTADVLAIVGKPFDVSADVSTAIVAAALAIQGHSFVASDGVVLYYPWPGFFGASLVSDAPAFAFGVVAGEPSPVWGDVLTPSANISTPSIGPAIAFEDISVPSAILSSVQDGVAMIMTEVSRPSSEIISVNDPSGSFTEILGGESESGPIVGPSATFAEIGNPSGLMGLTPGPDATLSSVGAPSSSAETISDGPAITPTIYSTPEL